MNKPIDRRIAYYLKKVADYNGIHISKYRNPHRHNRLMLYKRLMHVQIEKEGWA